MSKLIVQKKNDVRVNRAKRGKKVFFSWDNFKVKAHQGPLEAAVLIMPCRMKVLERSSSDFAGALSDLVLKM